MTDCTSAGNYIKIIQDSDLLNLNNLTFITLHNNSIEIFQENLLKNITQFESTTFNLETTGFKIIEKNSLKNIFKQKELKNNL